MVLPGGLKILVGEKSPYLGATLMPLALEGTGSHVRGSNTMLSGTLLDRSVSHGGRPPTMRLTTNSEPGGGRDTEREARHARPSSGDRGDGEVKEGFQWWRRQSKGIAEDGQRRDVEMKGMPIVETDVFQTGLMDWGRLS